MAEASLVKFHSDECHWTLLMISQHWIRWRHQAITWANVDPDLCRHMASLGLNELKPIMWCLELLAFLSANGAKHDYKVKKNSLWDNLL